MDKMDGGCPDRGRGSKKRSWHDDKTVRQLVVRLNRIEGQVRGIKRMIEEEAVSYTHLDVYKRQPFLCYQPVTSETPLWRCYNPYSV